MKYSSAVANEAGVSFENLAAYVGTVSSRTRLSAEMIGQAFRTMFVRMQQVKAGNIDETGMSLNNVEKSLAAVDIRLRDATDSFRPLEDVIEDVATKWSTLSEVQRAQISNAIAGQRQAQIFASLMQNYGDVASYVAAETENVNLASERYAIWMDSVKPAMNRVKDSWEGFWQEAVPPEKVISGLNWLFDRLEGMRGILGSRETESTWKDAFSSLENSSVAVETYIGGVEAIKKAHNDAGFSAALFVNKNKLIQEGFSELNSYLATTSDSYKKYVSEVERAAKETSVYLDDVVILSESEWELARASEKVEEGLANQTVATEELSDATVDAFDSMQTFVYGTAELTSDQFAKISGTMSEALFNASVAMGMTLTDINGNILASSQNVEAALLNNLLSFDSVVNQMMMKDAQTAGQIASYIQSLFSFAGGGSVYEPVAPSFKPMSSGGGGSSTNSVEKDRIDAQVKSLDRKKKALKDQLSEFKKYIDAQKESLKLQKEEKEYTDDLAKKNLSLAKLKSDIIVLSLDDSEEARARRLALEEEALNLEEEITADSEDRKYDLQIQALEDFERNYEDSIDRQIDGIDTKIDRLKDESSALKSVGGAVGGMTQQYQTSGFQINGIIDSVISKLSENGRALDSITRQKLPAMIQEWLNAGMTIDEATQKAYDFAYASSLVGGFSTAAVSTGTGEAGVSKWGAGVRNARIPVHHRGLDAGEVGGTNKNEVLIKALKGEVLLNQEDLNRMSRTVLPSMMSSPAISSGSGAGLTVDKLIDITVQGNMDESVLPSIQRIANQVVEELNKGMMKRGFNRSANSFSL